jgi:hypothetical protein
MQSTNERQVQKASEKSLTLRLDGEDFVVVPSASGRSSDSAAASVYDRAASVKRTSSQEGDQKLLEQLKIENKTTNAVLSLSKGRGTPSKGAQLPPRIDLSMKKVITRRFYAEAGLSSATITSDNMLAGAGGIAQSSSVFISWFGGIRLIGLDIYTNVATSSNPAAPYVYWINNEQYVKPEVIDRSVPAGVTLPSKLTFRPPKTALAALWQGAGFATPMFVLKNIGLGSVIDLTCEVALGDGFSSGLVATTVSTATAGKVYYLKLDGVGGVLYPTDLNTLP